MRKSVMIVGVLLVVLAASLARINAKKSYFSLAEKTQQADNIFLGELVELRDDYLVAVVRKTLKGSMPGGKVKVVWDFALGKLAMRPAAGGQFLFFTNVVEGSHRLFMREQGAMKVKEGELGQFEEAIPVIAQYDEGKSTQAVAGLLITMLRSKNTFLHEAALNDFMYSGRYKLRKAGIGEKDLGEAVIGLTRSPDKFIALRAAETLERIGGRASVPALIELVGSDNEAVSQVAARAFSNKTGLENTLVKGSPLAERKKIQAEWQAWWEHNKNKVDFR